MYIKIMSVSRFGNSNKNQLFDNVDKNYVDQKFVTQSTNLALKVNKSGDTLIGDLYLSCENDDERCFGIKDITEGKSISYLLGDYQSSMKFVIIMDIQSNLLLFMDINLRVLVAMFAN